MNQLVSECEQKGAEASSNQSEIFAIKQQLVDVQSKHKLERAEWQAKMESEVKKLELGFSETLGQKEAECENLVTARNKYKTKSDSLAKDVRALLSKIDIARRPSATPPSQGDVKNSEEYAKLKIANETLLEELARKSRGLVDAIEALATVQGDEGINPKDLFFLESQSASKSTVGKRNSLTNVQTSSLSLATPNNKKGWKTRLADQCW